MAKDILTETDKAAFKELAGLLEDRGLRDRFGVYFQHEHFDLADDEVIHEISDSVGRISLRRAIKKDQMPEDAFPSAWALDADGNAHPTAWCCD